MTEEFNGHLYGANAEVIPCLRVLRWTRQDNDGLLRKPTTRLQHVTGLAKTTPTHMS
ncbi:hypothetical protein DPMN_089370 [Dreissena polymorpha]|uniref:Uncharacterized protein n=1 Tax=Dreissena polymorpha TaxID=45954 RepID=A0A9D4KVU4_DREPO|nr:hypothetical protein DPMN_089370 [Dreissena polymorpha]